MPYIPQSDRKKYTEHLEELLCELTKKGEDDLGGPLNFCISYLITRLWENKKRYVRANTIRGALNNAIDEWYHVHVIPYEKKKEEENGKV